MNSNVTCFYDEELYKKLSTIVCENDAIEVQSLSISSFMNLTPSSQV